MAGKSIYPSIPAPGETPESMRATLDAIRQSMTMVIINAQAPSANYAPSSAAQVFVTHAQLDTAIANSPAATTKAANETLSGAPPPKRTQRLPRKLIATKLT
jgi:hypothetical protein